MADYYLISQLPSLDGIGENDPIPMSEERFQELCHSFLREKAQNVMKKITLLPSEQEENTGSPFLNAWNQCERNLRFALGHARAGKMNKSFDMGDVTLSEEYIKAANAAVEMENPMEAEVYLNNFRLAMLETFRPMDQFSEDYMIYYGLRLKLMLRIRLFDRKSGEEAYGKIYHSILNGDKTEAIL